jgi:hypothetical protein
MPKLIYLAITSLDGFIEDGDGLFDWAVPDAEVHTFINQIEAGIGTQPLRPADVRNNGHLADGRQRARGSDSRGGLCRGVAGDGQSRVLTHARRDLDASYSSRA